MSIELNKIYNEPCLDTLSRIGDKSIHCCITSPPYYGLRDYGHDDQIGLESTPKKYVQNLIEVFGEVRRVLRYDGTLWVNLGDSYASNYSNNGGYSDKSTLSGFSNPNTKGRQANENNKSVKINHDLKQKDLIGIPWMVAFALRANGWYLRQDIIWNKPNPMPESVTDRCTKSHEYMFLLSKSKSYYYDNDAIKETAICGHNIGKKSRPSQKKGYFNGKTEAMADTGQNAFRAITEKRNKRSVWTVPTKPYSEAHFATFPEKLIEPCVLAACPEGGIIYDPFMGAGTTALVANRSNRNFIGSEINAEYCELSRKRLEPYLSQTQLF